MQSSLFAAVTGSDRVTRRQALTRVAQLVGGALAASMLPNLAGGQAVPDSALASLRPGQQELLAAIVDQVIPTTDTPGAREVGVHRFIEIVWSEAFSAAERELFTAGLAEVDARARRAHGRAFTECSAGQQLAVLTEIDREAFAPAPPVPAPVPEPARPADRRQPGELPPSRDPGAPAGAVQWVWGEPWRPRPTPAPFWRTLKRLALVGYYTSEVGATEELQYQPVPGRFQGCVPLAEVGRAWAV